MAGDWWSIWRMAPVIHWFRRDFRLNDNTSLRHAVKQGDPVIPVYVLTSWRGDHQWTGPNRQQFLCGCLAALSHDIGKAGGRLIIREGDAVRELEKLAVDSGASAIHANKDPDPFGRKTERRLEEACNRIGIRLFLHDDLSLHPPGRVLTNSGSPYKVFTPYFRKWETQEKDAAGPAITTFSTPPGLDSLPLPDVSHWGLPRPETTLPEAGEQAALERMGHALSEILPGYSKTRDKPAAEATSRLSQDLRHGLLSIRHLYSEIQSAKAGAPASAASSFDTFIKELAWREFYLAILHHFPDVLEQGFNPTWRGMPWDDPREKLDTWRQGRTGFPFVDAGLRQLLETGFMHNRLRMITAMFLTKDLHLDWKLGESHFMRHLTDGEIASNNGGWQWSAGTGADAAPYFRVQNPWTQSARHDRKGEYIKRWVPELREVSAELLHHAPLDGKPIARGYPLPCVDHSAERLRTMAIFKKHRGK